MKQLTRAICFVAAMIAATSSFSDELSDAVDDYLNEYYDSARSVFLSYGTPGLESQAGDPIAQYYLAGR